MVGHLKGMKSKYLDMMVKKFNKAGFKCHIGLQQSKYFLSCPILCFPEILFLLAV